MINVKICQNFGFKVKFVQIKILKVEKSQNVSQFCV